MDLSSRAIKPQTQQESTSSAAAVGVTEEQPKNLVDQLFARKEIISKPDPAHLRGKKAKKDLLAVGAGAGKAQGGAAIGGGGDSKRKRHLSHKKDPIGKDEIKRTIFVGNLPNTIQHQQVEKFFAQKTGGEVEAARVRCVHLAPLPEGERDRGRGVRILRGEVDKNEHLSATAYVVFKDQASVEKAIALSGVVWKDRHLSIGGETPEAKPFAPRSSVYLGNLPYSVTDEQIWKFFLEDCQLTDVTRVRIPRDHKNVAWGNAKGFGYVEFASRESVVRALKLKDPKLDGDRKIRIFSVHKSKDAIDMKVTRREKRAVAAAPAAPNSKKDGGDSAPQNRGGRPGQKSVPIVPVNREETPTWMGQVADPRKKLSKELRWLSQHPNDRRAAAKSRHKDRIRASFIKKKNAKSSSSE